MKRYILITSAICSLLLACHKPNENLTPIPNPPDSGNNGNGNTKPAIVVKSFHADGGTMSYDDSLKVLVKTAFSNSDMGVIESQQGGTVLTELDGIEHGTVKNNNKGTLVLALPKSDTAVMRYFIIDAKGDTTTEYDAIIRAGGEIGVDGRITSFNDSKITYDANYIKQVAKSNNQSMLITQIRD